jgi:hypothetical protein
MLYYFPTLLPDEKLSHGWARYAERVPHRNAKSAFQELFGSSGRAVHLRFEKFETQIDTFASNLPHDFPYGSDYLIANHTLYPLYSFTLFKRRAIELHLAMKGLERGRQGGTSLIKPRTHSPKLAKYCVQCAKEDITSYGETYWHRVHQIPDIKVCADHQCWLENTDLRLDNRDGIGLMTAGHLIDLSRQPKYFDSQNGDYEYIQLLFAKGAKYFLNQPLPDLYLEDMNARYKSRLFEMGFASIHGIPNYYMVRRYLRSKIQPHVLQRLQEELYGFTKVWNTSLLQYQAVSPAIHILYMYFLDIEVKDFVEHPTTIEPFGPGPWPCKNPLCRNFNMPVIQTFLFKTISGKHYGIFTCGCESSYKVEFCGTEEETTRQLPLGSFG